MRDHSRMFARTIEAGRRQVGEPYFSVVLAFFNLVAVAGVIVVTEMTAICLVVDSADSAPWTRYPGLTVAVLAVGAPACLGAIAQLVPGTARWRRVRNAAGVWALLLLWPLTYLGLLVMLVVLPGGHACAS